MHVFMDDGGDGDDGDDDDDDDNDECGLPKPLGYHVQGPVKSPGQREKKHKSQCVGDSVERQVNRLLTANRVERLKRSEVRKVCTGK